MHLQGRGAVPTPTVKSKTETRMPERTGATAGRPGPRVVANVVTVSGQRAGCMPDARCHIVSSATYFIFKYVM